MVLSDHAGTFPDPGEETNLEQNFETLEQVLPKNEALGEFIAEPFSGEGNSSLSNDGVEDNIPGFAGSLPTGKGGEPLATLPKKEEPREAPYRPTSHLMDIHFAFNEFNLDETSKAILQENVAYLKVHPVTKIEIQGYCDERGSNNYNISLGQLRAHSVKSYLIIQGIDESRIKTLSFGEEKPFCTESNEKCWYQNRRAHFLVAN